MIALKVLGRTMIALVGLVFAAVVCVVMLKICVEDYRARQGVVRTAR